VLEHEAGLNGCLWGGCGVCVEPYTWCAQCAVRLQRRETMVDAPCVARDRLPFALDGPAPNVARVELRASPVPRPLPVPAPPPRARGRSRSPLRGFRSLLLRQT
jgi:hypothetical protein